LHKTLVIEPLQVQGKQVLVSPSHHIGLPRQGNAQSFSPRLLRQPLQLYTRLPKKPQPIGQSQGQVVQALAGRKCQAHTRQSSTRF
jgi:hypothetical protein